MFPGGPGIPSAPLRPGRPGGPWEETEDSYGETPTCSGLSDSHSKQRTVLTNSPGSPRGPTGPVTPGGPGSPCAHKQKTQKAGWVWQNLFDCKLPFLYLKSLQLHLCLSHMQNSFLSDYWRKMCFKLHVVQQNLLTSGPGGPYGPVICVPCRNVSHIRFSMWCLIKV